MRGERVKGCWVLLGVALAGACAVSCGTSPRLDLPPYDIQFHFVHSPRDGEETRAFGRDEPLIAEFYAYKRDRRAFRPEASFATMPFTVTPSARTPVAKKETEAKWLHPFVFVVKVPDGLLYRWYCYISESERQDEIERWQTEEQGIRFSLDLQKWVPGDFPWQAGIYEVKGSTYVSSRYGRPLEFGPASFYMDRLPEGAAAQKGRVLEASLESDKTSYKVGESITLRGYLKNIGERPFLVQTRYPFLEGQLIDRPTWDSFPAKRPVVSLRYSDFSRLEPGERVRFFQERFVAGLWDPHWDIGARSEMFPAPFAGPDREIVFRLKSDGLFPEDLLPDIGVWSGEVESNPVTVNIVRPEGAIPAEAADEVGAGALGAEAPAQELRPFEKGELPPPELMQKWRQMLQSPEPSVRLTAVKDMWRARHKETAAMLLSTVSDPDENVSREAMYMAEMNQKLGILTATEPVLDLLRSKTPFHRAHAARLTVSHSQPENFLEAMLAAEKDPADSVREWAYRFFAKTRFREGKPLLIRAVTKDPKPLNRAVAAEGLYYYGSEEACPALIEASADDDHLVRRNALHALISCGDGQTLPLLLKLANSEDPEDRRHALNTIGWAKWTSPDLRDEVLIKATEDPEVSVRAWGYELIGRQEVRRANDALRERLLSGKDIDQESLLFGLSRIADARSGKALLPFLEKQGRIGKLALEGVATSGNPSLISKLAGLMQEETDEEGRNEIGRAITVILEKNPPLAYEDQQLADSAKKVVVATAPEARVQRIVLYRPDWSVVDVEFRNGHAWGERWLLRQVAGEWRVLSRHGTWTE